MGALKTLLLGMVLGGYVTAPVALAQSQDEQLKFFASCAGRLSAQMEFQWMFDGAASEETKRQRAGVIEILEAMIPPNRGQEILAWRIEAKQALAVLLTRGTFNENQREARMAQGLALRQVNECRALLLG